jgi:ribosome-binding factor A
VTGVRVTADLWLARVFVRLLEGEGTMEDTLQALGVAAPFIRRELGKVLSIRRVPELRFAHDTTLDSAKRIEEVLKEVGPIPEETPPDSEGEEAAPESSEEGPEGER